MKKSTRRSIAKSVLAVIFTVSLFGLAGLIDGADQFTLLHLLVWGFILVSGLILSSSGILSLMEMDDNARYNRECRQKRKAQEQHDAELEAQRVAYLYTRRNHA